MAVETQLRDPANRLYDEACSLPAAAEGLSIASLRRDLSASRIGCRRARRVVAPVLADR